MPRKALTAPAATTGERAIEPRGIGVMNLCMAKHVWIASELLGATGVCARILCHRGGRNLRRWNASWKGVVSVALGRDAIALKVTTCSSSVIVGERGNRKRVVAIRGHGAKRGLKRSFIVAAVGPWVRVRVN